MFLSEEMKIEVRKVFEGDNFYNRSLKDAEVQDIADNLVSFGELLLNFAKNAEERSKDVAREEKSQDSGVKGLTRGNQNEMH